MILCYCGLQEIQPSLAGKVCMISYLISLMLSSLMTSNENYLNFLHFIKQIVKKFCFRIKNKGKP